MTIFHFIGDSIRALLLEVPMWAARWLFIGLLLALMGWIVQLNEAVATPPEKRGEWYEDLRIWAWVAVMGQVILYSVF